jgi:hypothetical protein
MFVVISVDHATNRHAAYGPYGDYALADAWRILLNQTGGSRMNYVIPLETAR